MPRSRRLLAFPVGIAALAAAVASSSTPASGAPGLQPVDGLHQAYVAEVWEGAATEPNVTFAERFFTGTAADQANKVAGMPTATYTEDEPTGSSTIVQEVPQAGDEQKPDDRGIAKWTGPFSGTLEGPIELRWYWTAADGPLNPVPVEVAIIADAGTDSQTVLAAALVDVTATGTEPQLNVHRLRVKGLVAETLTVTAKARYINVGVGLRVHYGSTAAPSGLGIPVGVVPLPVRQDNDPAAYTGPPLEVSATYIGRDAAEPTIGVVESGAAFMSAGAFDAVPLEGAPRIAARTEIWRSVDGGQRWESVQQKAPGGFTTVPPTTLDPYVYVDEDTGRVFTPDLYGACNYLQWSDDEGESWTDSPIACGQPINDHQTVVTGPPPEGTTTTGYPNVVYYCFNRVADASCGRSLDGGLTWLPAGEPAFLGLDGGLCGGLHGHIVTDKMGRLYLPKGHCERPALAISDDAGETWRNMIVNDDFRTDITHTAVDVDEAGNIYYLWPDADDTTALLSVSKDGGETWSAPVTVFPPGVKEANFPTIDAGRAGQIAITFPGSTVGGTEANRPWNYYVLTSLNADSGAPLFVSTTANPVADPIHRGNCGPGRCAGMFDFIDVEFSPVGEIWAAATDTCTGQANCNTADGVRAPSAEGVAVRQLSGPGMDGAPVPRPGTSRPKPGPKPAPEPAPLPSTGMAAWVMWLAAAGVALGLGGRRRIRIR